MKKSYKIYYFLFCSLLLISCEEFLDREPYNTMGANGFYNNADELNTAVIACYNGIHATLDNEFFLTEIRSDNTRHVGQGSTTGVSMEIATLDKFIPQTTNEANNSYWEASYHNIANCNTVLEHLDVVTDETLRHQFEAEAKFIRAYHYFNLVRLYGPLFLVTERIGPEVAKQFERSSIGDVYSQIIEDLYFATQKLPTVNTENNIGRVDQWAAKTLLAKVYLTLSKNATIRDFLIKAKDLLNDVEQNSGYSLLTSAYADVFGISNEMNKEILFAARYKAGGLGLGSPFANYFAPANSSDQIILGGGSAYNCPTEDLLKAFKSEPGDERKDFVLKEQWVDNVNAVHYTSYVTKYFSNVLVRGDAENDWPILRFADVLLMLGELENELNGPTPLALDYINKTRNRAGLPKLETIQVIDNKDKYRTALSKERRLEFVFENQRLFDLLRTDQLNTVMKNHYETEEYRNQSTGVVSMYYSREGTPVYVSDSNLKEWQKLLPIPYNVMLTAVNASQNPGY